MAVYITTAGYIGKFSVFPKRRVGTNPDGTPIWGPSLTLGFVRTGVNKETKTAEGVLNTDTLSPTKVEQARSVWPDEYTKTEKEKDGTVAQKPKLEKDRWKKELEKKLDELGTVIGFRRLKEGEKPTSIPPTESSGGNTVSGMVTVHGRKKG